MKDNLVIGRMHHHGGLVSERANGGVRIGLAVGGDPFNQHTRIVWWDFTDETFASMIAHLSKRGETGETYRAALEVIQTEKTVPV